jgi:MoxR-like ATPase
MTDGQQQTGLSHLSFIYQTILEQTGAFIVGYGELKELAMIGLLSRGHILIEGYPGTAKTTMVKALARITGSRFSRFQCAVDSQPADIIGIRIFDPETREFVLRKGPIFSNFLLIDEINRLSPKTQSAFIEAMSERQVTIDGVTVGLESPFIAIATQNPFEYEGVFPLIEAQKDRFMFSMQMSQLEADLELDLIRREYEGLLDWETFASRLAPVMNREMIGAFTNLVEQIRIEEPVLRYIRDLVIATRKHGDVRTGASSRASIALVRGSRVLAALNERDYVIPDDVKRLISPTFQHRLILEREAEISGVTCQQVIREILEATEVP